MSSRAEGEGDGENLKFKFYPHDFKFTCLPQIFVYHLVDGFIDAWDYIGGFIDMRDYIGGFIDTADYIWGFIDIGDESLQSAPVWSCGYQRQRGPV